MVEEAGNPMANAGGGGDGDVLSARSADHWLSRARQLLPTALQKGKGAKGFAGRWRTISSKLERLPSCLSDLSSHPCFSKNALCGELLQSVCQTLEEVIELAGRCGGADAGEPPRFGKLQMQSDLDSLAGKLDLNLRDCGLLIKTGVLGEVTLPPPALPVRSSEPEAVASSPSNVRELFARLQIGHTEAKHRAVEGLLEAIKDNEKSVLAVLFALSILVILFVWFIHIGALPAVDGEMAQLIAGVAKTWPSHSAQTLSAPIAPNLAVEAHPPSKRAASLSSGDRPLRRPNRDDLDTAPAYSRALQNDDDDDHRRKHAASSPSSSQRNPHAASSPSRHSEET